MDLKVTCIILILLLIASWAWFLTKKPEIKTETIVEERTDTVKVEVPVPVTVYKDREVRVEVPVEKVVVKDSIVYVTLEKEVKEYRDSTYYCKVSGIDPNLDYIETYNTTTTINTTTTLTRKPILVIGPSINAGWSPITKQFDATIGVSVTVPFYTVYGRAK